MQTCCSLHWCVLALTLVAGCAAARRPSVGAIRWDAWYWADINSFRPHIDIVGQAATLDVNATQWHYRVPFFGRINNATSVVMGLGNSTAVMAQENRYAQQAGIDYWAFCTYPLGCKDYNPPASECPYIQCCADNYALSYALLRYLELPMSERSRVNFTLILQAGWFPNEDHGSNETLQQEAARYVSYFTMPTYHKVLNGRPLIFVLGNDSGGRVKQGIALMAQLAQQAGLQPPYVTFMGDSNDAKEIGAQALSQYVLLQDGNGENVPFATNQAFVKQYYAQVAASGQQLVPPVTAGWDPRPREVYPVPWESGQCPHGPGNCWLQDPTMPQLTQAVTDALSFTTQYVNNATAANTILISAWNEYDEGHWICPSLQNGTQKLDAVKQAIQSFRL